MTFPSIRTEVLNSYNETPSDVACRKAKNAGALKERIQELIKGMI